MPNELFSKVDLNKTRSITINIKEGENEELLQVLKIPFNRHIDFLGFGKEKLSVILIYQRNNRNYGCGFRGEYENILKNVFRKLLDSESMYIVIFSEKLKEEWFIKKEIMK